MTASRWESSADGMTVGSSRLRFRVPIPTLHLRSSDEHSALRTIRKQPREVVDPPARLDQFAGLDPPAGQALACSSTVTFFMTSPRSMLSATSIPSVT